MRHPPYELLICALMFGAGCPSTREADEKRVKIGFLYSTEGFFGGFEPSFVDAARLAAEMINEAGGPLDLDVEIVPKNFAGKSDRVQALAKELIDDGVVAVLGPLVSPYSEALGALPGDGETPFFVLTSDLVFDDTPYLFNLLATQEDHATIVAARAMAAGQASMAVIYERTMSRADSVLEREYQERGGKVAHSFGLTLDDEADEVLAQIMQSPPAVITLVATPALGAGVLNRFLQNYAGSTVAWRLWPTLCIADFPLGVPGLETLNHEIISTSFQLGSSHQVFSDTYAKRFPSNVAIGHPTFDSVFAVALAVEASGSLEGARVRDALPDVTRGGTRYDFLAYAQARDALRRGEDIDYAGSSHNFDFGDDGKLERKSVEFVLCSFAENGKQVFGTMPFTLEP